MDIRPDGHIVSSGVKQYPSIVTDKYFGIVKARVDEVVYSDSSDNYSYEQYRVKTTQYVCRIVGSQFDGLYVRGAICASEIGGQFNYEETILSPVKELAPISLLGDKDPSLTNGDYVLMMFLYGDLNSGIIIKGFPHPQNEEAGKGESEGIKSVKELNGIETKIDKDGNFTITVKGLKDPLTGQVLLPLGVDTEFKIGKDGKISFLSNPQGTIVEIDGTSDKVSFTSAFGDTVSVSKTDGIQASTPTGTSLSMKQGEVLVQGTEGKMKLKTGKVALGGPAGELFAEVEKMLTQLDTLCTQLQAETHLGNLGYPTGTPINTAAYAAIQTQLAAIKVVIGLLKGSF